MRLQLLAVILTLCAAAGCGPADTIPGPPGPPGPPGATGPGGPPSGVTGGVFCSTSAQFGLVNVLLYHQRFDFTDGSALVACSTIATNTVESRKDGLVWLWPAGSLGNGLSHCWVAHDLGTSDGFGEGRFDFYLQPNQDRGYVTYTDAPGSGYEYTGSRVETTCEPS